MLCQVCRGEGRRFMVDGCCLCADCLAQRLKETVRNDPLLYEYVSGDPYLARWLCDYYSKLRLPDVAT